MDIGAFQRLVYAYYRDHGRALPWRKTRDPYAIIVSEIMLQQTQVERVMGKYQAWLRRWPTWQTLAQASLKEVLTEWAGLGYNRRASYLRECAHVVAQTYRGQLPADETVLCSLPGIGPYTAGAVMAFAFNRPAVVIDTNIRSVFIHHFFSGQSRVSDTHLRPLIAAALDTKQPRVWYNALMDYGAWLKETVGNPSRLSAHYARQSPFAGSDRRLRGQIIRLLTQAGALTTTQITAGIVAEPDRVHQLLSRLHAEKMIELSTIDTWYIP